MGNEDGNDERTGSGFWFLVAGHWLLVTGCWLLVAGIVNSESDLLIDGVFWYSSYYQYNLALLFSMGFL